MPSHSCLLLCAAASAFLRCSTHTQSSLTPLAAKKRLAGLKNANGAKRKKKAPSKKDADAVARAAAGDAVALTLDVLRAVQQPAFLAHPAFERMKGLPALAEAKPSSIAGAGTGLFAATDVPAGTLVAFYAVHAVGRDNHFPTGDSAFLADVADGVCIELTP